MGFCYKDPFIKKIFGNNNYYKTNPNLCFKLKENFSEIAIDLAYQKK